MLRYPFIWLFIPIIIILHVKNECYSQKIMLDSKELTINEFINFHLKYPNAQILDVRFYEQYKRKRISGAISAPNRDSLKHFIDTTDYENYILIYCDYKTRCYTVKEILLQEGFENVFYLSDGIRKWKNKGLKLDRNRIKKNRQNIEIF